MRNQPLNSPRLKCSSVMQDVGKFVLLNPPVWSNGLCRSVLLHQIRDHSVWAPKSTNPPIGLLSFGIFEISSSRSFWGGRVGQAMGAAVRHGLLFVWSRLIDFLSGLTITTVAQHFTACAMNLNLHVWLGRDANHRVRRQQFSHASHGRLRESDSQ